MNVYFGEPWPSGVCENPEAEQWPTPVGVPCIWCEEDIVEDDQGSFIGCFISDMQETHPRLVDKVLSYFKDKHNEYEGVLLTPEHRECQLRSVIGSYAHLTMGPHKVGACNDVETGLTKRQDALAVWAWVKDHGIDAAVDVRED